MKKTYLKSIWDKVTPQKYEMVGTKTVYVDWTDTGGHDSVTFIFMENSKGARKLDETYTSSLFKPDDTKIYGKYCLPWLSSMIEITDIPTNIEYANYGYKKLGYDHIGTIDINGQQFKLYQNDHGLRRFTTESNISGVIDVNVKKLCNDWLHEEIESTELPYFTKSANKPSKTQSGVKKKEGNIISVDFPNPKKP